MSTGAIIAIVVVALILIGVVIALVARARSDARQLERRRTEAATARREEADRRETEAARAERRARVAQAEAEQHRAEARLNSEHAEAYEQGLADDRLRDGEETTDVNGEGTAERGDVPREARR